MYHIILFMYGYVLIYSEASRTIVDVGLYQIICVVSIMQKQSPIKTRQTISSVYIVHTVRLLKRSIQSCRKKI